MSNYVTSVSDKSKKTALKCAIFGGFVGAHYFYVGRYGRGLLYACTFGLLTIGWILDIVKVLSGGFLDNSNQPLRK